MLTLYITWVVLWFVFMGVPNVAFTKGLTSYYKNPLVNSLWFILGIALLFSVFQPLNFFSGINSSYITVMCASLAVWLLLPLLYGADYYSTRFDRYKYQVAKVFEILFQQICILAGFLLLAQPWYVFGLIFFLIHTPAPFVTSRHIGVTTMLASLPGGMLFAYLYSLGPTGFLISTCLHFGFYAVLHLLLTHGFLRRVKPLLR